MNSGSLSASVRRRGVPDAHFQCHEQDHSAHQGKAEAATSRRVRHRIHGPTDFKVKQDGAIADKAAYMVIGMDLDGNKDILGMWMDENESSKF